MTYLDSYRRVRKSKLARHTSLPIGFGRVDDGKTWFSFARRVPRDFYGTEALGSLDELMAHLGVLAHYDQKRKKDYLSIQKSLRLISFWCSVHSEDRDKALCQKDKALSVADLTQLRKAVQKGRKRIHKETQWVDGSFSLMSAHANLARATARKADRRTLEVLLWHPESVLMQTYMNDLTEFLWQVSTEKI